MGEQLPCPLGRAVIGHRPIGASLFRERRLCVVTIDRARRGIDEMGKTRQPPCKLEHVVVPDKIGTRVGIRVLQRIANARLRREVQNHVECFAVGRAGKRIPIGNVDLGETETFDAFQLCQARSFQCRIVIGVQRVNTGDFMPAPEQRGGGVETDEPGGPREKYSHARLDLAPPIKWTRQDAPCNAGFTKEPHRAVGVLVRDSSVFKCPHRSAFVKPYFRSRAWAPAFCPQPRPFPKKCCRWSTSRSSNTPSKKPARPESRSSFSSPAAANT